MTKGTARITYLYEVEGRQVAVWREHVGSAYARNGNVGNATEYFIWHSDVDGESASRGCHSRASAYEHARAQILGVPYYDHPNYPHRAENVRPWHRVQDEMRANYRSQVREKETSRRGDGA